MDEREREAWRSWRAEPTPENAAQWAVCHSRGMDRPAKDTLFKSLDLDELYNGNVASAMDRAAEIYLGMPLVRSMVSDFHWITESHFWLLECRPSPQTLRELAKFYEDHDMKLEVGMEVQAKRDHQIGLQRSKKDSVWKAKAEALEATLKGVHRKLSDMRPKLNQHRNSIEFKRITAEVVQLQTSYDALKEENERLARIVQSQAKREKI